MNVSAIQAIPKRAIIATMPDLKIGVPGTSRRLDVAEDQDQRGGGEHEHLDQRGHRHRLDAATLGRDRRPDALDEAEDADRGDAREEDGDASLRVGQQRDLAGGAGGCDLAGGQPALVLDVVVEIPAVPAHHERHREDADDARGDR